MIRFHYRYQVNGMGFFPIDMLRYDSAWPYQETDASIISERMQHIPLKRILHSISLMGTRPPTVARWESFLWKVGPVEKVAV